MANDEQQRTGEQSVDNGGDSGEKRNGNGRRMDRNRRNWLWAGAAAVMLLAALLASPRLNDGNRTDPIADRRMTQEAPPGSPISNVQPDRAADRLAPDDGTRSAPLVDPNDTARMNARAANAAESVDGVRRAWAIVTGDTALVGLELESAITGSARRSTEEEVSEQVKELPNIDRVAVTSTPDVVARVRRISEAIADGKPISQFRADIDALRRDLM